MKKRVASLLWKGAIVAGSAVGTGIMLLDSDNVLSTLSYFTTQSNLITIAFFAWLFVREIRNKPADMAWVRPAKFAVTVAIALTGLVFNVMLRPFFVPGEGYDPDSIHSLLVHSVTPLFAVLDFFLFDVRGKVKKLEPLYGLFLPALYWVYVLVYAAFGGVFYLSGDETAPVPYFFMNIDAYGPWYALIVAAFVVLIGYALFGLDRLLFHRQRRRDAA